MTQINNTCISGKMDVLFPPNLDHSVKFLVKKLDGIDFIAYARVDKEIFSKFQVLMSKRFPEQFELLRWNKKNNSFLLPLAVLAKAKEDEYTKNIPPKNVTMYFVEITCIPTGMNIQNVVVTLPAPRVDHLGVARKTRRHIWKSSGTHSEHENSIMWYIPRIGASDRRVHLIVDMFCYDGWQDESQFFPIKVDFFYDESIATRVEMVVTTGDGHQVEYIQETVGHGSYIIHHPKELARRAAEAQDAALAWQMEPWDPWEDEEMGEDNFV